MVGVGRSLELEARNPRPNQEFISPHLIFCSIIFYNTAKKGKYMPMPKKPTAILKLSGAYKKDPQRERHNEPQPVEEIGEPAETLGDIERGIWSEIVDSCAPGVLTCQDRHSLELVCIGLAEVRSGDANPADRDRVFRQLGKFGMTPSERSNVCVIDKNKTTKQFRAM